MAIITVLPSGKKIETTPGTNLLKAAARAGLAWPQTCGGRAQCTTCTYRVVEGEENLSPRNLQEQRSLVARHGRQSLGQNLRLACQTAIQGDAVVQKNLL